MLKIGEVYTEMCIQITAMALVPQQCYHGYMYAAATSSSPPPPPSGSGAAPVRASVCRCSRTQHRSPDAQHAQREKAAVNTAVDMAVDMAVDLQRSASERPTIWCCQRVAGRLGIAKQGRTSFIAAATKSSGAHDLQQQARPG